jgi:hypothetical protein
MPEHEAVPYPGERRCGNIRGRNGDWHRNRQGEPCKRLLKPGAVGCKFHGGATKRAKKMAEIRAAALEAHEEAERMMAVAGVEADPVEHVLHSLHRAAALAGLWAFRVSTLDTSDTLTVAGRDTLHIHPFVTEMRNALNDRAKFAKMAHDMGVEDRRIKLEEDQGKLIVEGIVGMLEAPGLGLSDEQKAAAKKWLADWFRKLEG